MLSTEIADRPERAESRESSVEAEIRQGLDEWLAAVNSGSVDAVCALYAPDAVLLATFNPAPLTTPEERRKYFENFMARKNLAASIDQYRIASLQGQIGEAASGLYTFRFTGENGDPQTVKARFTFVFIRAPEGDWLIAAHHSSILPSPA